MRFDPAATTTLIKKRVLGFFRKKPAPRRSLTSGAPQFHKPAPKKAPRYRFAATCTAVIVLALAAIFGISRIASADFTLIAAALFTLCGVIAYDVITRRAWEQKIAAQANMLARNHDRLVREVARNRNDLAVLKETLAHAASSAAAQGRQALAAPDSAETRMLDAIISRLGTLADAPRPQIGTAWDEGVLELEIAPPPPRPAPDAPELTAATDPAHISDERVRTYLQHAVRADHIDVFLQPVVSLPQRKARMLEAFAYIRAGDSGHLPAARYRAIAERHKLLSAVDNLLLLRCLQMVRDTRDETGALPCVINIAAATLHDSGFMNDLVAFLAQHKKLAARLIFELPQDELFAIDESAAPVLGGLSQLGCRFSMDQVRSRQFNIHRLKALQVRFIKLDAQWLIREGARPGGIGRINNMKKQFDAAGIDLIVERIETEEELRELLDYAVDFGQGYLFARPDMALSNALARALSPGTRRAA